MNVLIVLADALRPDHLSCYGYAKPTSPNIDRLAREGVRFENCVSVSAHTVPPIVSVITGQYVATHGLLTSKQYGDWALRNSWKGRRTPLHLLKDNGFLVDGELVLRWKPLGFDRDQNDVDAYMAEHARDPWFYFASPYPTHLPYKAPQAYYDMFMPKDYHPAPDTLERMEIARTRMICHPPGVFSAMESGQKDEIGEPDEKHKRSIAIVDFKPEQDAPGIRALYDGAVKVFDDWIGARIARLESLGILDETIVVLVADHGEELLERGHIGHTSCNLMGTLYEESIKVPLIIRYPKALPKGKVITQQISQIDIMPTLFELLGLPLALPVDGTSLVPLITGKTRQGRDDAFIVTPPAGWQQLWNDNRRIWALRTNSWKLIVTVNPEKKTEVCELYNLASDPGERNNLAAAQPGKTAELKARLTPYMEAGRGV